MHIEFPNNSSHFRGTLNLSLHGVLLSSALPFEISASSFPNEAYLSRLRIGHLSSPSPDYRDTSDLVTTRRNNEPDLKWVSQMISNLGWEFRASCLNKNQPNRCVRRGYPFIFKQRKPPTPQLGILLVLFRHGGFYSVGNLTLALYWCTWLIFVGMKKFVTSVPVIQGRTRNTILLAESRNILGNRFLGQ